MKHVTWNDIVKLGTMNPIVQKNLDELGEMPGITHAYALMAMVDELDGLCERLKADAVRYRYLREPLMRPRELDVLNNDMAIVDGQDLDQAIDSATEKQGNLVKSDLYTGLRHAHVARCQVLEILRGAGFTGIAGMLASCLDSIDRGLTAPAEEDTAAWLPIETGPEGAVVDVMAIMGGSERVEPMVRVGALWYRMNGHEAYWKPTHWRARQVAKNDGVSGEKVANGISDNVYE